MANVSIIELRKISQSVLMACGVSDSHSRIITDSIVYAHCRNKGTHGITRLPIYVQKINNGLLNPETPITVIKDTPVISVIDAGNGFGQVAAFNAMKMSIEKAKKLGVGITGVRSSNNFATAGFISELAVKYNLIGIVLGNSGPAIAPTGGKFPLLGTNPLAIAFPGTDSSKPISLDMATSVAARGKIRLAKKNGEKIPFGWALNSDGKPTNDPDEAISGTMVPIGEAKGYGLSLAIDILAGMLTGAAFAGNVKPLGCMTDFSNYGHLLVALNPSFFLTKEEYRLKIDYLIRKVKNTGDKNMVFLPGERSMIYASEHIDSIEISDAQFNDSLNLLNNLQIKIRKGNEK